MSGIAFERVSKVFPDGTAAVVDFNLRIHDGEFCVLLGPSGCGKSTALRLAAGLEDVTRGVIRIGDRVVNHVAPRDRDIAMVFHSSALYPHLDVAENMGFPLKLKGEPAAQRFDRVRRTAGGLGIAQQLGRQPRQLSEGQRQRAALGRAIVRRPQAFLMDEPLSNLDANLRVEMRATIARLHRDLGTTMLYVTHDHAEAMALGDRVAVMRDGHLEQVDEPQVLYDRPTALFVAAFIGSPSMNLWQVRLVEQDGCLVVVCGKQRLVVPEAVLTQRKGLRSHVGGHLVLGLRPELLAPAGSHAAGSVLELPVTLVQALGAHLLVHLEAEGAGLQLADTSQSRRAGVREGPDDADPAIFSRPTATLTARLPPHTLVKPGQRLRLFVDLERAHFFDPTTQCALR
jgi:multiple sugar transport system ATP-binding protein